MDFHAYQVQSRDTDQTDGSGERGLEIHLLGLAGEAGSVASEYKKRLRDGDAHSKWLPRMGEELGDVMWYVAAIASQLGLDLQDIAQANIAKTRGRWLKGPVDPLDAAWPARERLPRQGAYVFVPVVTETGRSAVEVWFEGRIIGSQLTDASRVEDGYRFHDVFHLAYAVLLGWSPVTRHLLKRKRRSDTAVDENEDGGRSIVIEEGVAALVFAYAAQHHYLDDVTRLDQRLLDSIAMLTAATEVGVRRPSDWERAILAGFACFRELRANGGGTCTFDADSGSIEFSPSLDTSGGSQGR